MFRVLGGLSAGIGYVSIPFFLLMAYGLRHLHWYATNGGLAAMTLSAWLFYMELWPVALLFAILSAAFNVGWFLEKEKLTRSDIFVIFLGITFALTIFALSIVYPSTNK